MKGGGNHQLLPLHFSTVSQYQATIDHALAMIPVPLEVIADDLAPVRQDIVEQCQTRVDHAGASAV